MPVSDETDRNSPSSGDGHRLTIGAARLLIAMRDEGPDAIKRIESDVLDGDDTNPRARHLQVLVSEGYLAPEHPGSSDYYMTAEGLRALEAFEADWRITVEKYIRPPDRAVRAYLESVGPSVQLAQTLTTELSRQYEPLFKTLRQSVWSSSHLASQLLEASGLTESLRKLQADLARSFPKINLDAVHHGWACLLVDPDDFNVAEFLAETGIPLAGAAPPNVARAIMDAEPHSRERLLLANRHAIIAQCRHVLEHSPQQYSTCIHLTARATHLFESEHFDAAQALASCGLDPIQEEVLDEIVDVELIPRPNGVSDGEYRHLAVALAKFTKPGKKPQEHIPPVTERYPATLRNFRWAITAPLLLSVLKHQDEVGVNAPYSRHATAHPRRDDHGHLNETNALRSIMTNVSFLWALAPTPPLATEG